MNKFRCRKLEELFQSDSRLSALLHFATAAVLIAILVWYFLFSGFDAPLEFVYNQF